MNITTYRLAFLGYVFLFFAITFHYWGQGQVITPYRPAAEFGLPEHVKPSITENRVFSDYQISYIPEVTEQFKETKSGWLALWNKQNELGRPLKHVFGLSMAYLPSWIMAQLTLHSPYYFMTLLSLFTCFLSGIFIILFCKEVTLEPLAGLIAGISLATCPLFMFWLTFPMFLSSWCWAAGTLWALTRLARKMDLFSWGALCFSLYSLLMTGYPQFIVAHIYIFLGYGAYLAYQKQKLGWSVFSRFCILSFGAALLAVVLALPIYLDLLNMTLNSARTSPPLSFFTFRLSDVGSLGGIWHFLTLSTFPELLGNPINSTYLTVDLVNGISVTALIVFFSTLSLYSSLKKIWGWWLVILLFLLLSTVLPVFIYAVKHLGFNISSVTPLTNIILPLIIVVAYGIDALVKRSNPRKISQAVLLSTIILFLAIASAVTFVLYHKLTLHYSILLTLLIITILLASQYKKTYPILLLSATILIMAQSSYPMMFHQNIKRMLTTSPFVEKVRVNLDPESRFATLTGPWLSVLVPNLNATLRLPTIHTYNTVYSVQYQHFIASLGSKERVFGWNNTISPDFNSTPFWMSNISLILSPGKVTDKNLSYAGEESGVYFYKVLSRMGPSTQVIPSNRTVYNAEMQVNDPRIQPHYTPLKQLDQGDKLEFSTRQTGPSILILSQSFDSDWHAQVLQTSQWAPTKTMIVNGFFQGIWLPENTQKVRLEFKPYVARFAWIAPVFWLLFLILLILKYILCRKRIFPGVSIK